MKEEGMEYIKAAKGIMQTFYMGKSSQLEKYYTSDMECVAPEFREKRKDACRIIHKKYRLVYQGEGIGIVTGCCSGIAQDENWDVTMVLRSMQNGMRIQHIHISQFVIGEPFEIKDIRERLYRIHASEILYLEAFENHVIWHCQNYTVETMGLLGKVEKTLPKNFVRVHRSFIVNRSHVFMVARCYAQMDTGETIQIPVKKYREVKRMLAVESKADSLP